MGEQPLHFASFPRRKFRRASFWAICIAGLSLTSLNASDIAVNRANDTGVGSVRQGLTSAVAGDNLAFDPVLNGATLENGPPLVFSNPVTLLDANSIYVTDNHAFNLAAPLTVNWAGSLRLNGILSDGASSGSLALAGTGTVLLSSANTYSGGTSISGGILDISNSNALGTGALTVTNSVSNPTLILHDGINLQNNVTLGSALTVNTATGATSQLSGIVSGSGSTYGLITTGSGTLVLSGQNSFTNGIFVTNDSTIRAMNSSALGSGVVSNAGVVTLDMANGINVGNAFNLSNSFIANVNSGSAKLSGGIGESVSSQFTKTGAGTLILSGSNSYTGGTIISQGVLQGDSISLQGNITNNAGLVFNQTTTGTYAGVLDGNGSLTKNGPGTLIMTGASGFTGPSTGFAGTTTVNSGELQVNGSLGGTVDVTSTNAVLTGTGTVGNVINNGYLQPGTGATNNGVGPVFNIGTLTANGNFTQQAGGTTEIKVNSAGNTQGVNNDLFAVAGQAKLDGMLKVFAVGGGAFATGTQYTILTANGGVSGQYALASSNLSMFGVDVAYGPNSVTFQFHQTSSFLGNAVTSNQRSVGTALDAIGLSSSGNLFSMINALGTQSAAQQQQAINELSGEMFGNVQTLGLQIGDQFQRSVTNRLVSNGQFLVGSGAGLSPDTVFRGQSSDATVQNQFPMYGSTKGWLQGYGVGGSLRSDGNGAGTNYSQGGAIYGMDWGQDDSGCVGITGGNSYVGFSDGFNGGGSLTAYQVGLYLLKHNETGYVLGTTNYGYNSYGTHRSVTVSGFNQSLQANYGGNQFGASVEAGLNHNAGRVHVQPLIGLQYLFLAQQGFTESGGPAALSVAGGQANSLRFNVGARLATDSYVGPMGSLWTPYTNLRLVSDLLNNDRVVNASFVGAPAGGAFTTSGTRVGQVYGLIGEGAQVRLNDRWSLFGGVDLLLGERITAGTGSLAAIYYW